MARSVHRACGLPFSGLTAFDRHLRWSKGPPWVSCREPVEVGLVWSDAREAWATHIGPLSDADAGRSGDTREQVSPLRGRTVKALGAS
jgi:hypothetical protein